MREMTRSCRPLFRIDIGGDVEQGFAEFLRPHRKLAGGDVVDRIGYPRGLGLLRRQQGPAAAADLNQPNLPALVPAGCRP